MGMNFDELINNRFEAFMTAVKAMKGDVLQFNGKRYKAVKLNKSLAGLLDIELNGQRFNLLNERLNKQALAAAGVLGPELESWGLRNQARHEAQAESHKAREEAWAKHKALETDLKDIRAKLEKLWGPYADKAWQVRDKATRSWQLATAAREILDTGAHVSNHPEEAVKGLHISVVVKDVGGGTSRTYGQYRKGWPCLVVIPDKGIDELAQVLELVKKIRALG